MDINSFTQIIAEKPWMVLNIKLIVWLVRSCGQRCFCHADSRAWTDKGYLLGEDIGNIFYVPYRTNILLLPPYPSKTRPVKFQSKTAGKKLQGPQTTYYTAVWYLLTPIKSTPTSPLKAARSRTEESTWAGQTLRRRPMGPRLSEDWQMRIYAIARINIPTKKETGKTWK